MKTIDELMKGQTPGSLTLISDGGVIFVPYFQNHSTLWTGLGEGKITEYHKGTTLRWAIYQEPVEMEDRWQWVTPAGLLSQGMYSHYDAKHHFHVRAIKLHYTKTQFPKGD